MPRSTREEGSVLCKIKQSVKIGKSSEQDLRIVCSAYSSLHIVSSSLDILPRNGARQDPRGRHTCSTSCTGVEIAGERGGVVSRASEGIGYQARERQGLCGRTHHCKDKGKNTAWRLAWPNGRTKRKAQNQFRNRFGHHLVPQSVPWPFPGFLGVRPCASCVGEVVHRDRQVKESLHRLDAADPSRTPFGICDTASVNGAAYYLGHFAPGAPRARSIV